MTIVASDQKDVSFIGASMSARLSRSKTLGTDRSVTSRQIYINACCFLERRKWLEEGWRVLGSAAQYDRDYLLPAPSTNCKRLSAFRITIRYCFRDAKPCIVFALERKDFSVYEGLHVVLDAALGSSFHAEQHQGSRSAQRRKRLFERMERTRQRHVCTCSVRGDVQSSTARSLGALIEQPKRRSAC